MTSVVELNGIEDLPRIAGDSIKNESLATTDAVQIHQETRGGELIPRTPLTRNLTSVISGCALFSLSTDIGLIWDRWCLFYDRYKNIFAAAGALMTILGVVIYGLMGKYATKHGPMLWWVGVGPFMFGILGLYAASSRSRRYTYVWSVGSLLLAVTQTAIMGYVGNFTSSNYDVWPLHSWRADRAVCGVFHRRCYCQDYYHGVYSLIELPNVRYIYKDHIKWRETTFDTCSHLGAIASLFWSFQVAWGIFLLSALIGCAVGLAGSVCAKQSGGKFQKLKEEIEEDGQEEGEASTCSMGNSHLSIETQQLEASTGTELQVVEVHSRF